MHHQNIPKNRNKNKIKYMKELTSCLEEPSKSFSEFNLSLELDTSIADFRTKSSFFSA